MVIPVVSGHHDFNHPRRGERGVAIQGIELGASPRAANQPHPEHVFLDLIPSESSGTGRLCQAIEPGRVIRH